MKTKSPRAGNHICWQPMYRNALLLTYSKLYIGTVTCQGGSVVEWLACWIQEQKGLGSNHTRDVVG